MQPSESVTEMDELNIAPWMSLTHLQWLGMEAEHQRSRACPRNRFSYEMQITVCHFYIHIHLRQAIRATRLTAH